MKTLNLCQLLLGTDQLHIQSLIIEDKRICLEVESLAFQAICPACQTESEQVHSTYTRYPAELPWADWTVVLQLRVKRFFCRNSACSKCTFAESFPNLVARYARRTQRVLERQRQIRLEVAARRAETLLQQLGIGLSDTTSSRIIRGLPEPPPQKLRVVGVDDWAKRKGQRYGTLVVDLERSLIVDVLADRTQETVSEWLRAHEGLEFVSRDRSKTYAEAIAIGAPMAIQVADRWHLVKNLSETVFKLFQKHEVLIKRQLRAVSASNHNQADEKQLDEAHIISGTDTLTSAEERRKVRIEQTHHLHKSGWTQKAIAAKLNLHPKTVRKYLRGPHPQSRRTRRVRLLDPYRTYLFKRWQEGCHNAARLCQEIQQQGYPGQATIVRDFVQQFRQAGNQAACQEQLPTLRALTWCVLKKPTEREEKHEKWLTQLQAGEPELATTVQLARAFCMMIRERQPTQLKDWLSQAEASNLSIWRNFAAHLKQDEAAVRAALTYDYSNGPTEGHVNRLKSVKRLMYGRAKDDLLRKRVLWQGHWPFT